MNDSPRQPSGSDSSTLASLRTAEEHVSIGKERKVTGKVLVTKKTYTTEQSLEEELGVEEVEVERRQVDAWVDGPLPTRQEGDTTIFPVIEEIIVVEKRFHLVEEVHVTRRKKTESFAAEVPVRRTQVIVERRIPHGTGENEGE